MKKVLIFLFILLLPTQLAYHFWPNYAYIYGLRIDYLAPKIFFTDILLILLLLTDIKRILYKIQKHLFSLVGLLISIFLLINFLKSPLWQVSAFQIISLLKLYLLIIFIYLNKELILKSLKNPLFISSVIVLIMTLFQIYHGRSLGGLFYWLGERRLTIQTPGIAKQSLFGKEILRPYATFSHPNSLAGFYLAVALILLNPKINKNKLFALPSFLTIFLSASKNTYLAFLLLTLIYLLQKQIKIRPKKIFMITLFTSVFISQITFIISLFLIRSGFLLSQTFQYRLELAYVAGVLYGRNPLLGIGAANFIPALPSFYQTATHLLTVANNFWLQPVHNVYQLILVEFGLLGLITALYLLKNLKNENLLLYPLLAILLTGLLDHYWLTLEQNKLLLSLMIGLSI